MPQPRIPGADAEDLIERLERAFLDGDPRAAFEGARAVTQALRETVADAARLRFRLNFGTPACDHCDGLRAGPGIVATCHQIRECHYDNVKEESGGRHRRLLGLIGRMGQK